MPFRVMRRFNTSIAEGLGESKVVFARKWAVVAVERVESPDSPLHARMCFGNVAVTSRYGCQEQYTSELQVSWFDA